MTLHHTKFHPVQLSYWKLYEASVCNVHLTFALKLGHLIWLFFLFGLQAKCVNHFFGDSSPSYSSISMKHKWPLVITVVWKIFHLNQLSSSDALGTIMTLWITKICPSSSPEYININDASFLFYLSLLLIQFINIIIRFNSISVYQILIWPSSSLANGSKTIRSKMEDMGCKFHGNSSENETPIKINGPETPQCDHFCYLGFIV